MTRRHAIPVDVAKEIRALAPAWLLAMAVVGLAARFRDRGGLLERAGVLAYFIGSAALGGLVMGHEYASRTITAMLSAPTSRSRMFAIKTGVLVPMLLSLAATAFAALGVRVLEPRLGDAATMGLATLLGSLFLAPWITMACRNPLAGAIFGVSLPCVVMVGAELLTAVVQRTAGIDRSAADRLRADTLWMGMTSVSLLGAFMTWRTFVRLEDVDPRDGHLSFPFWPSLRRTVSASAPIASRHHNALRALFRKELRLQQLTLIVPALYVSGFITTMVAERLQRIALDDVFVLLTIVHGIVIALLTGSLASGEERHFGVLESQVLMPMSMARQWAAKTAIVFGLVLLLGAGLPLLLAAIPPAHVGRIDWSFVGLLVLLAAVSLYVSSLSVSGLMALLFSLPASLFAIGLFQACGLAAYVMLRIAGYGSRGPVFFVPSDSTHAIPLTVVFAGVLVVLAAANHRSSDRAPSRVWRQIGWVAGSMLCASVAVRAILM